MIKSTAERARDLLESIESLKLTIRNREHVLNNYSCFTISPRNMYPDDARPIWDEDLSERVQNAIKENIEYLKKQLSEKERELELL